MYKTPPRLPGENKPPTTKHAEDPTAVHNNFAQTRQNTDPVHGLVSLTRQRGTRLTRVVAHYDTYDGFLRRYAPPISSLFVSFCIIAARL